jgi:hypothetical protein
MDNIMKYLLMVYTILCLLLEIIAQFIVMLMEINDYIFSKCDTNG